MLFSFYGCCKRFSDLTPETNYRVGDVIRTTRSEIIVEKFQWSNGTWVTSGKAIVDTRGYSHGLGKDIHVNNVNLNFKLKYPVSKITLKFGELGGNNNIILNNTFKNISDLIELNGTTLAGVLISVNAIKQGNNWYGEIVFNGNLNSFSIGGQELWIDDVCHNN
jgi:hypothetical protein